MQTMLKKNAETTLYTLLLMLIVKVSKTHTADMTDTSTDMSSD